MGDSENFKQAFLANCDTEKTSSEYYNNWFFKVSNALLNL